MSSLRLEYRKFLNKLQTTFDNLSEDVEFDFLNKELKEYYTKESILNFKENVKKDGLLPTLVSWHMCEILDEIYYSDSNGKEKTAYLLNVKNNNIEVLTEQSSIDVIGFKSLDTDSKLQLINSMEDFKYTVIHIKNKNFLKWYFECGFKEENDFVKNDFVDKMIEQLTEKGSCFYSTKDLFDDCYQGNIRLQFLEDFESNCKLEDNNTKLKDLDIPYKLILIP